MPHRWLNGRKCELAITKAGQTCLVGGEKDDRATHMPFLFLENETRLLFHPFSKLITKKTITITLEEDRTCKASLDREQIDVCHPRTGKLQKGTYEGTKICELKLDGDRRREEEETKKRNTHWQSGDR